MARTLVTIGISHYCEKARWALDRAGLGYEERAYAPGAHVWPVRRAGGRTTPVLVDGDVVITDSTDVLDHVQRHPDSRFRPWPDGPDGDRARAWEARFDDEVGPHVRRVVYFHLLADKAATVAVIASRSPAGQVALVRATFPVLRFAMRRSMRIDAAGAERSAHKLEVVLADVERELADGRRYLVGDAFSGADLALAALLGPAVLAPYLPITPDVLPAPLLAFVDRTKARPAGAFVTRLWAEERALRG